MPLDREGSHSSEEGGECVEVAARLHTVHVRDSKDTVRPGLAVGTDAWAVFVGYAVHDVG
ncbi:DUF397 domain-containing protein [Streptomyces rhizosphaerihabitans]|uniref:DUF397 domain-containing protein n=1 Tax=Streptomyces rhizosphaerihabitans TaxID=1266770 RepID=UPI0021BF9850|nr:DUF397 domain-containing protein [Streptomyces rhizosphaerihabitans]MCT9006062.1 DUF397 domain-containing protein [Streptomyces rhizosphaerihabitans]